MTKKIKLNSTGTYWTDGEDFFSYGQQMSIHYKNRILFDDGFYSMTTRKHQSSILRFLYNPIYLTYADFNKGAEWSIINEIKNLEYNIEKLQSKRKTKKCLDTIDEYTNKIIRLQELLNT